tara:strand:+ start:482 stop:760 length:279 start_codon:yes stop_codon:yes gene_type:complete
LLKNQTNKKALRIEVKSGGCSGFQYEYTLIDKTEPNDIKFSHKGARIIIDDTSINFLDGSTIDYVDSLIESSFKINNPNASSACGCGVSFTI